MAVYRLVLLKHSYPARPAINHTSAIPSHFFHEATVLNTACVLPPQPTEVTSSAASATPSSWTLNAHRDSMSPTQRLPSVPAPPAELLAPTKLVNRSVLTANYTAQQSLDSRQLQLHGETVWCQTPDASRTTQLFLLALKKEAETRQR